MEYVYTTTGEASKGMKAELKAKFPGVKFSVKSKNYSGGCLIDVSWDFGPTDKAVEKVVSKYQYGRFNGMDDSSSVEHTLMALESGEVKALGGAKFVFTHRGFGKNEAEFLEGVQREICALQGVEFNGQDTNIFGKPWNYDQTARRYAYKTLRGLDLTEGYKGVTSELVFSNNW